jgi:hypothetical protein
VLAASTDDEDDADAPLLLARALHVWAPFVAPEAAARLARGALVRASAATGAGAIARPLPPPLLDGLPPEAWHRALTRALAEVLPGGSAAAKVCAIFNSSKGDDDDCKAQQLLSSALVATKKAASPGPLPAAAASNAARLLRAWRTGGAASAALLSGSPQDAARCVACAFVVAASAAAASSPALFNEALLLAAAVASLRGGVALASEQSLLDPLAAARWALAELERAGEEGGAGEGCRAVVVFAAAAASTAAAPGGGDVAFAERALAEVLKGAKRGCGWPRLAALAARAEVEAVAAGGGKGAWAALGALDACLPAASSSSSDLALSAAASAASVAAMAFEGEDEQQFPAEMLRRALRSAGALVAAGCREKGPSAASACLAGARLLRAAGRRLLACSSGSDEDGALVTETHARALASAALLAAAAETDNDDDATAPLLPDTAPPALPPANVSFADFAAASARAAAFSSSCLLVGPALLRSMLLAGLRDAVRAASSPAAALGSALALAVAALGTAPATKEEEDHEASAARSAWAQVALALMEAPASAGGGGQDATRAVQLRADELAGALAVSALAALAAPDGSGGGWPLRALESLVAREGVFGRLPTPAVAGALHAAAASAEAAAKRAARASATASAASSLAASAAACCCAADLVAAAARHRPAQLRRLMAPALSACRALFRALHAMQRLVAARMAIGLSGSAASASLQRRWWRGPALEAVVASAERLAAVLEALTAASHGCVAPYAHHLVVDYVLYVSTEDVGAELRASAAAGEGAANEAELEAAGAALRSARARASRALRRAALPLYCALPSPAAAQHAHWVLGSPAAAAGWGWDGGDEGGGGDAALRRAALGELRADAEKEKLKGGRAA